MDKEISGGSSLTPSSQLQLFLNPLIFLMHFCMMVD